MDLENFGHIKKEKHHKIKVIKIKNCIKEEDALTKQEIDEDYPDGVIPTLIISTDN